LKEGKAPKVFLTFNESKQRLVPDSQERFQRSAGIEESEESPLRNVLFDFAEADLAVWRAVVVAITEIEVDRSANTSIDTKLRNGHVN
jgi:hypothetical protein